MKTRNPFANTTCPNTTAGHSGTACAPRLLPLLLLLALPAVVQAGFTFTTNNGAITITYPSCLAGAVTIPSMTNGYPVTGIGDGAFEDCRRLTSVTIPASVTSIGDEAFDGCSSLTSVTIGTNVTIGASFTSMGQYAFGDCPSLTSVTLGTNLTDIGDYTFYNCTSLTTVTIPNSVISIGELAFQGCYGLTNVTIGTSVTSIGEMAFYQCDSLTNVTIPASVTNIGFIAFIDCTSLTAITVDTNNPAFSSVGGVLFNQSQTTLLQCPQGKAGSYTIPDSVTNIGDAAFIGCYNLTSVTIPNSVTSIEGQAFASCTRLISVKIGTNVTSIGDEAFSYCSSLTNVTIPGSVTNILVAFRGSSSLNAIAVDTNNPAYSSAAGVLFNKSRTTLVEYPGGIAGGYTIPSSVTNIGYDAFIGCTNLTSVTIGSSVTSIGDFAFDGCTSLQAVWFRGNAPDLGPSVFSYTSATVYYLPGTTGWNPQVQANGASFGVRTNQFGFTITGNSNLGIVVQACTNLANPAWSQVGTNTLTGGSSYFSDPHWTNYTRRCYCLCGLAFAGLPALLWNPQAQTVGVRTNRFGFTITGTSSLVIVVEVCTNLANPAWYPVGTNTLTGGSSYFSDPAWANYPGRFYRLRLP